MRGIAVFILSILSFSVFASNKILDVGLYWGEEPSEITVQAAQGSFKVYGNGKDLLELKKNTVLRIKSEGGLLHVRTLSEDLGTYYNIK